MNKPQFIQSFVYTQIGHPDVLAKPKDQRMDFVITMAEAAWDKLADRGYGARVERDPNEKKDWYNSLEDGQGMAFDKAWKLYKRVGERNAAAKAWTLIDQSEYEHIFYAIGKYYEQCHTSGTSIAHFSTWLNGKRWQSFEKQAEKPKPANINTNSAEIKHLEKMIKHSPDGQAKTLLESQLDRLKRLNHGKTTGAMAKNS